MTSPLGPEDPRRLLVDLGVRPPDDAPARAMDLSPLDELRGRICQDLDATQGPFRRSPPWVRSWPAGLAALSGVAFILSLRPASLTPMLIGACIAALVAAATCFAGIVVAPARPGLGERLSWAGLGIALLALTLEAIGGLILADGGFRAGPALRCGTTFTVASLIPLGLLIVGLRRSGLPVRRLHLLGLCAAALAIGGLGIWRHCAPRDLLHMAAVHVALPGALLPPMFLLATRLVRRRARAHSQRAG